MMKIIISIITSLIINIIIVTTALAILTITTRMKSFTAAIMTNTRMITNRQTGRQPDT